MARRASRGLMLVIGAGGPKGDGPPAVADTRGHVRQHAADVEAAFTGRPQPHGTYDESRDGVSERTAGYMELDGAAQDGDCDLVEVEGGVSGEGGSCDLFEPVVGAATFACRGCRHYRGVRAAPGGRGNGTRL